MQRQLITLFAGLFAVATAWPEARAADPEEALRAAGLVLSGQSYILAGEAEAESIKQRIAQIEYALLRMERGFLSRMGSYISRAKETGKGETEWQALNDIVNEMAENMVELWRDNRRYPVVVKETEREYARLAADPQIKEALRALNKGRHPKRALGPVVAYDRNVAAQSVEILKSLGYRLDGGVYWLSEEDELVKLGAVAQRLWRENAENERRGNVATPAQLSARRADLIQSIRTLGRRVDALEKRREELLADGEAIDAVREVNKPRGNTRQVRLGAHPGLEQVLQDLKTMEGSIHRLEIPRQQAPAFPVANEPPAALPGAPKDLSKLPAFKVLFVPDGDTILVQKRPGQARIRLLGVASPPFNSAPLRIKFLQSLIRDQLVALEYAPGRPGDKGPVAAWVYRVSDGLDVNLEVVRQGYGVPAEDAPAPIEGALRAAEREARLGERGLWSPAVMDEAERLARQQQQRQEELSKQRQGAKDKKERNAQKARDWMAAENEQVAFEMIARWARSQHLPSPGTLYAEEQRRKEEERRRAPEIDAGPAAGALALLVLGVLMLADHRRARLA